MSSSKAQVQDSHEVVERAASSSLVDTALDPAMTAGRCRTYETRRMPKGSS